MRVRAQILITTLVVAFTQTASAVNFAQCLSDINNMTIDGKTDNYGHPLPGSTPNATAITYKLCVSRCGAGQEPFRWTVFSQQFSSWLLPWLALVSQLPFGANDGVRNLESMLLTLGSPMLAAYSLGLTVLNGRWIAQRFASYRYPNVQLAVRILSSLQQSPVRVDTDDARLASLIVLPQNDVWWKELESGLNYTHTWSISAVASIAWVITAYIFTVVDYFSQGTQVKAINSNGGSVGGSVGTLWLWLLPVVVGWLQISPKCDTDRLNTAMEKANALAYVATSTSPREAHRISSGRAITIVELSKPDEARLDERCTPPIFNYARFLPWVQAVMVVSDTFQNVSKRDHDHVPIFPNQEWHKRDSNNPDNARLTTELVEGYCRPRPGSAPPGHRWGLDDSAGSRMFIASALALTLQWGTTGAAVVIVWFTPTVGLGCRSASYLAYGCLSTLVWMMLVTSSILTYYSSNPPARTTMGPRLACGLSIFLRRAGKVIAALNALWIVAAGIMQFGGIYNRCFCNGSVFGLGKDAYNVITLTPVDVTSMRGPWAGGFCLAAMTAALVGGFVTLFVNPPLPPSL